MIKRILSISILLLLILILSACTRETINTQPPVSVTNNYSSNKQAIIDELNKVRTDPAKYSRDNLEPLKSSYTGSELADLNECIDVLNNTKPMSPLSYSQGMTQAAQDHATEQGNTGATGHYGKNNSTPFDRMNKYGTWGGSAGENISYGYSSAHDIVIQLLVDSGVPGRGHRKNILKPSFLKVGIGTGTHTIYQYLCVMDFAASYTENSD